MLIHKCKSCGKPISFYQTATGKTIPLNPLPREDGNLVIRNDVVFAISGQLEPLATESRYVSHFATCPQAAQHRLVPKNRRAKERRRAGRQAEKGAHETADKTD